MIGAVVMDVNALSCASPAGGGDDAVKQASRGKASAAWFQASITWRGDAGVFGDACITSPWRGF